MKKIFIMAILVSGCSGFFHPLPKLLECGEIAQRCMEAIDKAKAEKTDPDALVWVTAQCANEWAMEGCSKAIKEVQ